MYNNDITYDKSWATAENNLYHDKLDKYFVRTACGSSCPAAWSREVFEMLEDINRTFNIGWNYGTYRGYYFKYGSPARWLFIDPFKSLFAKEKPVPEHMQKYMPQTTWGKLVRRFKQVKHDIRYAFGAGWYIGRARFMNWLYPPRIWISQVKEKYGELVIYYHADDKAVSKYVDQKIAETKVKLAMKGAYYELHDLWDSYSSWNSKDYDGEYTTDYKGNKVFEVKHYRLREVARELLTDEQIKAIEDKVALIKAAEEEDEGSTESL